MSSPVLFAFNMINQLAEAPRNGRKPRLRLYLRERIMFAGIIEAIGKVVDVRPQVSNAAGGAATRLTVRSDLPLTELRAGASVAVNGVCLTLTNVDGDLAAFDVVPESWHQSNLSRLQAGSAVNLERALQLGDRIDGHFVQGHVDGLGRVERIETGGQWRLWVATPPALAPYVVAKGSIAIDGVSLTLATAEAERFAVAVIPTTLRATTLGDLRVGDLVNLETDILARVVVQRLDALLGAAAKRPGELTWETLRAAGYDT